MSGKTCVHCNDPDPFRVPELHLAPGVPTPSLAVGQVVVARRATGVCAQGERGLVIGTYTLNRRPGWTIMFRNGRADGWSPCEAGLFLQAGPVVAGLTDYCYGHISEVRQDLDAGLFDAAFAQVDQVTDPAPRS